MRFSLPFSNVVPAAGTGDAFRTIAAIRVPDTAVGVRIRISQITLGFAKDAPADIPMGVKLVRIADVSAGGAGTSTAVVPAKKDPASLATNATGIGITAGVNFTTEPTAYESVPLWADDINDRNGIIKSWDMDDDKPRATEDMILGLLVAPRTSTVVEVSGTIEFELY